MTPLFYPRFNSLSGTQLEGSTGVSAAQQLQSALAAISGGVDYEHGTLKVTPM